MPRARRPRFSTVWISSQMKTSDEQRAREHQIPDNQVLIAYLRKRGGVDQAQSG